VAFGAGAERERLLSRGSWFARLGELRQETFGNGVEATQLSRLLRQDKRAGNEERLSRPGTGLSFAWLHSGVMALLPAVHRKGSSARVHLRHFMRSPAGESQSCAAEAGGRATGALKENACLRHSTLAVAGNRPICTTFGRRLPKL